MLLFKDVFFFKFQPNLYIQSPPTQVTSNVAAWRCYNKGAWRHNHYVPENPEQDCRKFVSMFLKDIKPKSWIFLGDSTMRRLFGRIVSNKPFKCRLLKKCQTDCAFNVYINMSVNAVKGKVCKTRSDGCKSELYGCQNKIRDVEYIQNHFTKNSIIRGINVTKYSLLNSYLRKNPKDICVVNAGLHDQGHNLSNNAYVNNVKGFLSYLNDSCKRMIWISINCVLGLKRYDQSNKTIRLWNDLIEQMLYNEYPEIAYIDMYPMSTIKSMHQDNVHMKPVYYAEAAKLFV